MARWIEIAALLAGGILIVVWQLFNGPITSLLSKDALIGALFVLFAGAMIHREILDRSYLKKILEKTAPEFEKCESISNALTRVIATRKNFKTIRVRANNSATTQPMFEHAGIQSAEIKILVWSPRKGHVDDGFKTRHDAIILQFAQSWRVAHEKLGLYRTSPQMRAQEDRPQFYYYIFDEDALVFGPLRQISGPALSSRTPFLVWGNNPGARKFIEDVILQFDDAMATAEEVDQIMIDNAK